MSRTEFMQRLDGALLQARNGDLEAALAAFAGPELAGLAAGLEPKDRFTYLFEYGQLLGKARRLADADTVLTKALTVAAEEISDLDRCKQVWYWLLHWVREAEDWALLERQAQAAYEFGQQVGSGSIRQMGGEFSAWAHRGLGRRERARYGAERILSRLRIIGADAERVGEWEDFVRSVGGDPDNPQPA